MECYREPYLLEKSDKGGVYICKEKSFHSSCCGHVFVNMV